MNYRIEVSGCDDTTRIDRELTDEQAAFLKEVATAITAASSYGCMPTMSVEPLPTGDTNG